MRTLPLSLPAVLIAVCAGAQPAVAEGYDHFQLPSGNIACAAYAYDGVTELRCDILDYGGADPQRRPAYCDLDWGYAFIVRPTGPSEMLCAGDTVADSRAPVLGYGRTNSIAGVVCRSSERGLDCANAAGHGFHLSRAQRRLY